MAKTSSLTFNRFEIYSNEDDSLSVDLRAGVPRIEYRESVFMPYVSVTVAIVDVGYTVPKDDKMVSLLEGIKCQGGEKVLLAMTDASGNKIDLSTDDDLRLVKSSNINETFSSTSFIATMISSEALDNYNVNNECLDLYSGRVSDIVRGICSDNLKSDKNFVGVDESRNNISLHGLGEKPYDFLTFIQQLGIPNEKSTQTEAEVDSMAGYLFWQTSEGFNFKSLDTLFKTWGSYLTYVDSNGRRIKNFIEDFNADSAKLPPGFDDQILFSSFNRTIDLIAQFQAGGFGAQLETMDLITLNWDNEKEINPPEEGNRIMAGRDLPNLGDYATNITRRVSMTKAKGQTVISGDSELNQVQKTDEEMYSVDKVVLQSLQNYRQKMNFSAQVVIPGDFSLHAGDLVYCEFRERSDGDTTLSSSERNSGIYMIADLCHFGTSTKTYTGLHLVRDSYGVKTND